MSIHTMQFMLDHGVDIVGALDINPHVVGKDIGEIIGGEAHGVSSPTRRRPTNSSRP